MVDAAILTGSKPAAVTPGRPPQRDARDGAQGEGGFGALLVAVEQIAALGGLGLAQGQSPAPETAPPPAAPQGETKPVPGLGRELTALIHQRIAGSVDAATAAAAHSRQDTAARQPGSQRQTAEILPEMSGGRPSGQRNPFQAMTQGQPVQPGPANQAFDPAAFAREELQQRSQGQAPRLETQVAGSPKIEATLQQHASGEASNPVVRQVASNLQFVVRGESERLRIDLHPEELGRVQVQLQKAGGVARLTIVAESQAAFEALQRGAGGLQQSLSQAGFDTDDMRFEHREGRGEERQQQADERRERSGRRQDRDLEDERREVLIRPARASDRHLFL